jgi:hypothetical protein
MEILKILVIPCARRIWDFFVGVRRIHSRDVGM